MDCVPNELIMLEENWANESERTYVDSLKYHRFKFFMICGFSSILGFGLLSVIWNFPITGQ